MPSISATFAWAVPVDVEVLGAHLEAYYAIRETLHGLRMCHRFGRDDSAHITKLPPELVSAIEEILHAKECEQTIQGWCVPFRCFQNECRPMDHLPDQRISELRTMAIEGGLSSSHPDDEGIYTIEDLVDDHVSLEMVDDWIDQHNDLRMLWEDKVHPEGHLSVLSRSHPEGHFSALSSFFKSRFGLEIWISNVHFDNLPQHAAWPGPAPTTVAYLKLPSKYRVQHDWQMNPEWEISGGDAESGYGIPAKLPSKPSKKAQLAFKSAMKILGLTPRLHPSQAADWQAMEKASGETIKATWEPQLTLLLQNAVTSGD